MLSATPLSSSAQPVKKNRRRRGSGKGKPSGPVIACDQVSSMRVISLFLRALSPREKGYALKVLLALAKEYQRTAIAVSASQPDASTKGGEPC